ncbi:MAG: chorismate-binding protein [Bdellovibrionaceae bacterium]|nr:chorismate-binding protein [Pseudobdellovibrionaceae bacterium]
MDMQELASFFSQSQGALFGRSGEELTLFFGNTSFFPDLLQYPAVFSGDFFLEQASGWTGYENVHTFSSVLQQKRFHHHLLWQEADARQFRDDFQRAQKFLQSGEIDKIVLTTVVRAPRSVDPQTLMMSAISQTHPNTYVYGQWKHDEGFLGLTPEMLFTMSGTKHLATMALAGTASKQEFHKNSQVLFSEKNKREHAVVVDDILERVKAWGQVHRYSERVLELETLVHICTPIEVELTENVSVADCIRVLHPTPALGISPREKMDILKSFRRNEKNFGAPFAVARDRNHTVCVVGIRKLSWDSDFYYIRCGCGIVKESQLEDEWQELLLKIEAVKKLFLLNDPS